MATNRGDEISDLEEDAERIMPEDEPMPKDEPNKPQVEEFYDSVILHTPEDEDKALQLMEEINQFELKNRESAKCCLYGHLPGAVQAVDAGKHMPSVASLILVLVTKFFDKSKIATFIKNQAVACTRIEPCDTELTYSVRPLYMEEPSWSTPSGLAGIQPIHWYKMDSKANAHSIKSTFQWAHNYRRQREERRDTQSRASNYCNSQPYQQPSPENITASNQARTTNSSLIQSESNASSLFQLENNNVTSDSKIKRYQHNSQSTTGNEDASEQRPETLGESNLEQLQVTDDHICGDLEEDTYIPRCELSTSVPTFHGVNTDSPRAPRTFRKEPIAKRKEQAIGASFSDNRPSNISETSAFGQGPSKGSGTPAFGQGPSKGSGTPAFGPGPSKGSGTPAFGQGPSKGSGTPAFGPGPSKGSGTPAFGPGPSKGSGTPAFGPGPSKGSGTPAFGPGPSKGSGTPAFEDFDGVSCGCQLAGQFGGTPSSVTYVYLTDCTQIDISGDVHLVNMDSQPEFKEGNFSCKQSHQPKKTKKKHGNKLLTSDFEQTGSSGSSQSSSPSSTPKMSSVEMQSGTSPETASVDEVTGGSELVESKWDAEEPLPHQRDVMEGEEDAGEPSAVDTREIKEEDKSSG